ncbi:MAG: putative transporter substrate-binding protein [Frankiales bacterium]|jgi:branched-chain amino acid transport system substrate-binding protein|nr:putative transporter substrate-binding protein [Frankiales bacterium]
MTGPRARTDTMEFDMPRKRSRLIALLFAGCLVASACGGSSEEDTGTTEPGAAAQGGEIDLSQPVEVATGTTLDLPNCPSDWSATEGLTDTEITLFMSLAESGPLATFGTIDDGMRAYFEQMEPIAGRKVVLKSADDAYDPARTVSNVREALDTVKPFSMVEIVGTPHNLAVRDTLQEACMPQLFNSSGFPAWGDPKNYPWTIGSILAYNTEVGLWCDYIKENLSQGGKPTVAGLFLDNDFGKTYREGMQKCAEEGVIELVKEVSHDPAAPDVTSQSTTIAAAGADVIVLGTSGGACSQSMAALANVKAQKFLSYTCQTIPAYFKPIDPAGAGVLVAVSGKDASMTEDAAVQKANKVLSDKGLDPQKGSYFTGVTYAHLVEETLRAAAAMEGGLNRVNLMRAVWNADFVNPLGLEGSAVKTDGTNDAYIVEAARFAKYVPPTAKGGTGRYEFVGEILNGEGSTGSVSDPK